MSDDDDIDGLAAEHALGTLTSAERAEVEGRLAGEPALAAAVADWQRRLGPLHWLAPQVRPPEHLLPRLKARVAEHVAAREAQQQVISLTRSRRRWRAAALGFAAAACLLLVAGAREIWWVEEAPTTYVAVLQKDAMSPAFLLCVDTETRMLTVTPVDAEGQPDKSFELWLVHDSLPGPRSLGLLSDRDPMTTASLKAVDPDLYMNAMYTVSIEPAGGSQTGQPSGPVVYAGKLLPPSI